jgi:hypothetical protein
MIDWEVILAAPYCANSLTHPVHAPLRPRTGSHER